MEIDITPTDKYIATPRVNLGKKSDTEKSKDETESIKEKKSETEKSILDELDDLF